MKNALLIIVFLLPLISKAGAEEDKIFKTFLSGYGSNLSYSLFDFNRSNARPYELWYQKNDRSISG